MGARSTPLLTEGRGRAAMAHESLTALEAELNSSRDQDVREFLREYLRARGNRFAGAAAMARARNRVHRRGAGCFK